MFNMKAVQPARLDPETKFRFRCHKDIKCFTKCCSNIDIMLTPYDVLRLKNRLGMSSEEFLEKYTYSKIDEKSSHPYIYLKMSRDEKRSCPFVTFPEGCTIYADRPVSCRYYPIGQATLKKGIGSSGQGIHEEFYFFVKEPHCLGYEENTEWTVESWRADQESSLYDEMNREWKGILMRRNIPGGKSVLDPKKQTQFYMASYDLDRFKRYVFESKFIETFDIAKEEIEKLKTDEVALMNLGFKYLKYVLMLEEALKVKPEVVKAKKAKE
ncbi:MAG: YkgJ family cysteine cluster protein [Nitrospirae bacterium]|nr:MAG: YkgJ family cysteine cluster protein [Nitrospirota bacterium]